jgi:hypothetical protein
MGQERNSAFPGWKDRRVWAFWTPGHSAKPDAVRCRECGGNVCGASARPEAGFLDRRISPDRATEIGWRLGTGQSWQTFRHFPPKGSRSRHVADVRWKKGKKKGTRSVSLPFPIPGHELKGPRLREKHNKANNKEEKEWRK